MFCGKRFSGSIVVLYRAYHLSGPTRILPGKPGDRSACDWPNSKIPGDNGVAYIGNPGLSQNRERCGRSEVYRHLWLGCSHLAESESRTKKD